jgi:AcrR family transcriptional regulator
MLTAADALFASAQAPDTVSTDAIASAAGVGKGTLFRAFGSRDGILDALWERNLTALRAQVEAGEAAFDPEAPARDQIIAFLDALLAFKLRNWHLIRARETNSAGIRRSANYRWMHGVLRAQIEQVTPAIENAGYVAHVLLGAIYIDLIEELLAGGQSAEDISSAQAALVTSVLG